MKKIVKKKDSTDFQNILEFASMNIGRIYFYSFIFIQNPVHISNLTLNQSTLLHWSRAATNQYKDTYIHIYTNTQKIVPLLSISEFQIMYIWLNTKIK